MEQHPVPQNVTTFQFRLVGDMTLKQFGYLGGGVLLAYISSKLPLPFFFTWPMTLFFALGGFGLAFVPVEERPMDIWIMSFLRNTYSPTQYVWQKTAKTQPTPVPVVHPTPQKSVTPSSVPSLTVTTQRHSHMMDSIQRLFQKTAIAPKPHVSFSHAFDSLSLPPIVKRPAQTAPPPIQKPMLEPIKQPVAPAVLPIQHAENTAVDQQKLAEHLAQLKHETKPIQTHGPALNTQPTVRSIGMDAAIAAGLPKLTTFPNIVTGIVKDDRGNLLPGALVTVRDTNDTPLRALKTNKLGQFAASTPLPNGTYVVEVEDPLGRYTFDRAQITVNGTIVSALEIIAKSQKKIEREKLEKAIFGQNQI